MGAAGAILLIVLIVGILLVNKGNAEALDDPDDKSRVYLDEIPTLAILQDPGPFELLIFRQSGNLHSEYHARSAAAAIKQAMATFRRAKIDAVGITLNTNSELEFRRLFYSHRGRAEGKKVGSIKITRKK